jgi:hypothetical protein
MGKKKDKRKEEKEIRYLYDLTNIAYHEAGHTVAILAFEAKFDHVDIINRPDKDRSGHVTGKTKMDHYGVMEPLRNYIVDFCGGLAQSRQSNMESCGGLTYCSASSDCDDAVLQLAYIHEVIRHIKFKNLPPSYNMCYRKLRDELFTNSRKLVNDNWTQIELIAKELLAKKKLTYQEVITLLIENNMYDNLVAPPRIKLEPGVSKE